MRVLVTGATGFTGSYVAQLLLQQGIHVRCTIRPAVDTGIFHAEPYDWVVADLSDVSSLKTALEGVDALINIASIGFGHAPYLVEAARAAGVRRAIFISTTAIFTTLNAPSKAARISAEEIIRNSGLDYTILRPTMIYGSSRDRNICRLIRYLQRWPVIPIFGSGEYLLQPVYVNDVAAAVKKCLRAPKAVCKSYDIPGAAPVTFNQVIDIVCELLGRKVKKLFLPTAPFVAALSASERLSIRLPIKAEQILRLNENKAFDFSEAAIDFGYNPRSFNEGIRLELAEMNARG